MSSLSAQVGGSHYKNLGYQPVELSHKLRLNGIQLLILKYLTRFRDKNGLEDLTKARHCCYLAYDLQEEPFYKLYMSIFEDAMPFIRKMRIKNFEKIIDSECVEYCKLNKIYKPLASIKLLSKGEWISCAQEIDKLIESYKDEQRRFGEKAQESQSSC